MKTLFRLLFIVLLSGMVVACDALPMVGIPTLTPPPSPTPVELSQTFSGRDLVGNTLTLNFPMAWAQSGNADSLLLGTSASLLDNAQVDMGLGDVGVSISMIPVSLAGLSVPEGVTPSPYNILLNFINSAQTNNPNLQFSTPEIALLGDKAAALVRVVNTSDESLTMIVDVGTGYAVVVAAADIGELASFLPTIQAIAQSITYGR